MTILRDDLALRVSVSVTLLNNVILSKSSKLQNRYVWALRCILATHKRVSTHATLLNSQMALPFCPPHQRKEAKTRRGRNHFH